MVASICIWFYDDPIEVNYKLGFAIRNERESKVKCQYCNSSVSLFSKTMNPKAGESSKCPTCGKELAFSLARGRFALVLIPLALVVSFVLPNYVWVKIIGAGAAAGIAAFFSLKAKPVGET